MTKESNVVSMTEKEKNEMTKMSDKGRFGLIKKYEDESVRDETLEQALKLLEVWQQAHPGLEVRFYSDEQKYVVVKLEEVDLDAVLEELVKNQSDAEGVTIL